MGTRCVVLVGFGRMLLSHLDRFLPPESVIVVEDPDVIAKRQVVAQRGKTACVREVVAARYHQNLECVDAVAAFCDGVPVTAVIAGLEYGVPGAAAIADRLGLPGASPSAAALLSDKLLMREATAAAGIRNPPWRDVRNARDVADFAAGGPVVLKPANRHASLGVQLLAPDDDIDAAWAATVSARDDQMLPARALDWRYVAERLVTGHEYSAEALVQDGAVQFLNVTDKLTAPGRYPVELGHVVPAPVSAGLQAHFAGSMSLLVEALKFSTGILHAEWMADEAGLVFIECAGRVPGDSIVDLIDAAYGFSLVRELVGALSGQPLHLPASPRTASAVRFVTGPPGRVTRVSGLARACRQEGVLRASVSVRAGDDLRELRSSWDRSGEVVATGATPELAAAAAAAARALITIETARADGN